MAGFGEPRPPARSRLRELLAQPEPLLAPGAYDALSARLVEQAGFGCVYLTGFGASASLLGRPDIGLLSGTEMADHARRLAQAVDVPLIADADNGYGNALNVIRTVRELEQAGVAALQLEDQVLPKRCGHMTGKSVIDLDEAVAKVRAAASARTDGELVLIARTDAAAVHGIDAAIDRARRFAEAGADLLFVESPNTLDDIEKIATELADHRLVFNMVEGGRTEDISVRRLAELGFAMVLFPISTLLAASASVSAVLATLRADASAHAYADRMQDFGAFLETIGLGDIRDVEQRFSS